MLPHKLKRKEYMGVETRKRPRYMGTGTHNINEKIIMDILIKLPVTSLLRFKCVAKFWKTLICEPYFKQKHLNFHSKNEDSQKLLIGQSISMGTFHFSTSCLSSIQIVKDVQRLDDWPSSWHGRVECCCNGLFLIGFWTQPSDLPPMLMLWNPSTREKTILPDFESPSDQDEDYAYGLGYDSTSDDYKILKVVDDPDEEDVIEILSLKSGSWRKIDGTSNRIVVPDRGVGFAFLHGAFHWRATSPKRIVVTLNISNEMYGEIPYPEIPRRSTGPSREVGLSLLEGMLCFYVNDTITTNLWVMKDYGIKGSWTNLLNIPSSGVDLIPIHRFSNGEVLLSYSKGKLGTIIHKISEGSCGPSNPKWPLHSDGIDANTIQDTFVYTESLISPKLSH